MYSLSLRSSLASALFVLICRFEHLADWLVIVTFGITPPTKCVGFLFEVPVPFNPGKFITLKMSYATRTFRRRHPALCHVSVKHMLLVSGA